MMASSPPLTTNSITSLLSNFILPSITCLLFMYLLFKLLLQTKKQEEPPFPGVPVVPYKKHFLLGHFRSPQPKMEQVARQKAWCVDYADPQTGLCSFYIFSAPIVSVLKAAHAQKVLRATTYKRGGRGVAKLLTRCFSKALGRKNILLMNGKEWKIHRSSVTRALHSQEAMEVAQRQIYVVARTLIHSIVTSCSTQQQKQSQQEEEARVRLPMVKIMKMATMDVFGAAALGRDLGCCQALQPSKVAAAFDTLSEDVVYRLRRLLHPTSHLYFWPNAQNQKFKEADEILRGFLRETIEVHQAKVQQQHSQTQEEQNGATTTMPSSPTNHATAPTWDKYDKNLLYQLLSINNETSDAFSLNTDEFIDFLVVLLFAGYDTTANAVSYALYQIATHPQVEQTCLSEVRRVLGDNNHAKNVHFLLDDVVEALPYTHAVLLEGLRLYPPAVSINRTLEKDILLEEHVSIPKGTTVRIPIYHIQRYEGNFPRPLEFLPQRWVSKKDGGLEARFPEEEEDDEEEKKQNDIPSPHSHNDNMIPPGNRNALVAFAGGARNCAGKRFALQEGTLLLALLVQALQFKVPEDYTLETSHQGLIMEAKDGLPLWVCPRTGSG